MVASNAQSCPQCGSPDKGVSPGMIAFFVIVSLVVAASWLFPKLFFDRRTFDTRPAGVSGQEAVRGRDAHR
jgi:hypothetical protein